MDRFALRGHGSESYVKKIWFTVAKNVELPLVCLSGTFTLHVVIADVKFVSKGCVCSEFLGLSLGCFRQVTKSLASPCRQRHCVRSKRRESGWAGVTSRKTPVLSVCLCGPAHSAVHNLSIIVRSIYSVPCITQHGIKKVTVFGLRTAPFWVITQRSE